LINSNIQSKEEPRGFSAQLFVDLKGAPQKERLSFSYF